MFNLSRFNKIKKSAQKDPSPSLGELYPEGETEATKEFGPVHPEHARAETYLFPEGEEIQGKEMSELADYIAKEIREERSKGVRISEILQLQGEKAESKLRSAKGNRPRFDRLLVLTAFHPNPYVRWTGIHDFGDEVSELHLKYLLNDNNSGIRSQAQWEMKRRTQRETGALKHRST